MKFPKQSRRRMLQLTGMALTTSIAGCGASAPKADSNSGEQNESSGGSGTTQSGSTESGHQESNEGGHGHGDSGQSEPVEHAEVTMVTKDGGTHFEPHLVRIKQGGTVTWKAKSGSHSTTAYHKKNDKPLRIPEGANPWDSGILSEQGKTFEQTFETPGVYDYFCIPHESTGMIGSVIVGTVKEDSQPGLQPPQESLPSKAQSKIKSLNQKATE